jgi:hypothetical protein
MTQAQEAELQERKAARQAKALQPENRKQKAESKSQKAGEVLIAGWKPVTDFMAQQSKVQTAGELLTAREWLEEEFGRLAHKGIFCKIVQHPEEPSLIALYRRID